MKNKTDRLIRKMEMRLAEDHDYMVEGYASTFEPYVLYNDGKNDFSEVIDRHAFDDTDMSDVVLRVDHEGAVYARTSAGSLNIDVDDHGLHIVADLGRTENSRRLYEDIAAGNYPQMSFAFAVDTDEYDSKTHTRKVTGISKLFDVSPVSFPANPGTELDVSTRAYFDGVIEAEKAERLEAERRSRKALELRIKLNKEIKHEH